MLSRCGLAPDDRYFHERRSLVVLRRVPDRQVIDFQVTHSLQRVDVARTCRLPSRAAQRSGDDAASSNTPAEPGQKHKSGGNMGAGQSGGKSFGAEKPETRDDNGSREFGRDWDGDQK